jgi:Ni2+-binding GTPase involved in maturation of urease and hydrogenase
VIQEKINTSKNGKNREVYVVGLYGMSGIGKTSICKALCNEFVTRFHGRVCHAELERRSKEELLREVLRRLSDTSHEVLKWWNEDEVPMIDTAIEDVLQLMFCTF